MLARSSIRLRVPAAALAGFAALGLALGALVQVPALGAPSAAAPSSGAIVDLNAASEQDLAAIPGIGDVMAKRIVDFRKENGPFRQVDDLLKVKGIGEKSLEKLRPYVSVGKGAK
jgi:competence protein ComEA